MPPDVEQTSGGSFNNSWVSNFHCGLPPIAIRLPPPDVLSLTHIRGHGAHGDTWLKVTSNVPDSLYMKLSMFIYHFNL